MLKKHQRPIYLNIINIKFPITAIGSILHRISGFFLFIIIGPTLWLLKLSLSSSEEFYKINDFFLEKKYMVTYLGTFIITILWYHIIFGIRQILMDLGYLPQTLSIGKISANIVFYIIVCLFIYFGIHIWCLLN